MQSQCQHHDLGLFRKWQMEMKSVDLSQLQWTRTKVLERCALVMMSRSEQWIADLPAKQVGGSNMRYQPVQYVAPLDNQSWVYMFVKEGQTLWFGQTDLWQGGGVSKSYFIIPTLVQHNANANLIWFDLIQVIWDGGVFRNASKKLKAGICNAASLKLT